VVGLALPSSSRACWAARGALLGYALLLSVSLLSPERDGGLAGTGLFDLRTGSRIGAVAFGLALHALVEAARFLPVGVLAVLATPWAARPRASVWPILVTAGPGSLLIAAGVRTVEIGRPWQWPGPSDLLLPAIGCAAGIAASLAWWGDRTVRRTVLLTTAAGLAVPVLLGLLVLGAAEREPLVQESPSVTSEEKRRLYLLIRHKNPKRLTSGETRRITLASRDIDLLFAWGLPLVLGDGRAAARVDLAAPSQATLSLSVRVPGAGGDPRFLNLVAGALVDIDRGRLTLADSRLRIGRVAVPEGLLGWLSPAIASLVQAERRVRPILAGVQDLDIGPDRLTVAYGRMELPPGLLAGLIWGEGSGNEMQQAVRAHVERLLGSASRLPRGEHRFGAAVEVAFAFARERSATSPPVLENRAALLALGILLGHSRLEQLVGPVIQQSEWRRAAPFDRVTLRGRTDWTKHFFVSAALTVLSAQTPSDAAGLFKEELDAGGGSGFSFGDLMADRAGTTFALLATRNDAEARALQERLAGGFRVDDFFPEAADLPEGIQDAELQSRYGGVGGPLFREYAAEVERRLWRCSAYRDLAPASMTDPPELRENAWPGPPHSLKRSEVPTR
jgi:hypothetical protein